MKIQRSCGKNTERKGERRNGGRGEGGEIHD